MAACLRPATGEEFKAVSLTDPEVTMRPAMIAAAASMMPRQIPPSWCWELFCTQRRSASPARRTAKSAIKEPFAIRLQTIPVASIQNLAGTRQAGLCSNSSGGFCQGSRMTISNPWRWASKAHHARETRVGRCRADIEFHGKSPLSKDLLCQSRPKRFQGPGGKNRPMRSLHERAAAFLGREEQAVGRDFGDDLVQIVRAFGF